MVKSFSIHKFKEYVEEQKWHKIIYNTENQIAKPHPSITFELTFDRIVVDYELDTIFLLKRGEGILSFDNVRSVVVTEAPSPLWTVISIHCKNPKKSFGHIDAVDIHTVVAC